VATGFGDGRPARRDQDRMAHPARIADRGPTTLREPLGEPRVSRVRQQSSSREFDVPEFMPRR
jgi:hypothetical protein